MPGYDDPVGGPVKTAVSFVMRGIAKKDTRRNGGRVCGERWLKGWDSNGTQKHEDAHKRVETHIVPYEGWRN